MSMTSGNTLSVPPRSIELGIAEASFPAMTQTLMTVGIIPNTHITHQRTTIAHMSTSKSSEVPQTLESTYTDPISVAELGEHRASIQTTVNKLGDLIKRFRALMFDRRDQFFHQVVANILPIT